MNITVIDHDVSKKEAAEMLGLKSYKDLPDNWLITVAGVHSSLAVNKSGCLYDILLSSIVWCNDGSRTGYPYPLTVEAYGYLMALDKKLSTSFSVETEERQFYVYTTQN